MVGRSKVCRSVARLDKLPKYAYSTIYENTCGNFRQKENKTLLTEILTTNSRRTSFVYVARIGVVWEWGLFIPNYVPEKLSTTYEGHMPTLLLTGKSTITKQSFTVTPIWPDFN